MGGRRAITGATAGSAGSGAGEAGGTGRVAGLGAQGKHALGPAVGPDEGAGAGVPGDGSAQDQAVTETPTDQFAVPVAAPGTLSALDGFLPMMQADPDEPTPVWDALLAEFREVPE